MFCELSSYYEANGISAKSYENQKLKCKHYEQCSFGKGEYFIPAKEAFVSTHYEKHNIPRLLVISLDPKPSPSYKETRYRSLEGVRDREEISPRESYYDWGQKTHWRKTYDMVYSLLKEFIPLGNRNEVRHYFAHTNSAKCHDKKGNEHSSDKLFNNCSEYLSGEISILDPDIIVTQGSNKYFVFMNSFPRIQGGEIFLKYLDLIKVHPVEINHHNVIWIEMNHPCRRDDYYRSEDVSNFSRYRELISEFWKSKM